MRKIAAAAVICLILMLLGGCSISDKIYYGENEHWEIQLTIRSCMNGKGRWDDYRHGQEQMYCAEIVIKPKYPAYKYLQRDAWMASAVIEYDDGRPVTAAFDIPAQAEGIKRNLFHGTAGKRVKKIRHRDCVHRGRRREKNFYGENTVGINVMRLRNIKGKTVYAQNPD